MRIVLKVIICAALVGCGAPEQPGPLTIVSDEALDVPLARADDAERARFHEGDARFDAVFRPADGLGPLYIRASCASCHQNATNGPGVVEKMARVESDGVTPAPGVFPFGHSIRPYVTAGATTPVKADDPTLKLTQRVGLPILGRGYLEAIRDDEIERVEREQATANLDGVSGRINRVTRHSQGNPGDRTHAYTFGQSGLIGRFGAKARVATLDDFAADALQGDMGITSPLRPEELPNPDGLTDDLRTGTDVSAEIVNALADYVRMVEIPHRAEPDAQGKELFERTGCAVCHVPSLRTRADYPIAALRDIDAPVYSDLLLHDMGDALADGLEDESATSREWRTAPLVGLRFLRSYLHDGRAQNLDEAVLAHESPGSEANAAAGRYRALTPSERQALLDFVAGL